MLGLARIIGNFEKPRVREIAILLYKYTPRKYIQRLVFNLKSTFDKQKQATYVLTRKSICILL